MRMPKTAVSRLLSRWVCLDFMVNHHKFSDVSQFYCGIAVFIGHDGHVYSEKSRARGSEVIAPVIWNYFGYHSHWVGNLPEYTTASVDETFRKIKRFSLSHGWVPDEFTRFHYFNWKNLVAHHSPNAPDSSDSPSRWTLTPWWMNPPKHRSVFHEIMVVQLNFTVV